jgi:hypothetical protein
LRRYIPSAGASAIKTASNIPGAIQFELTLPGVLGQLQKVEDVRVLGRLEHRLCVWRIEHFGEVRHRGSLALVQPQLDLSL